MISDDFLRITSRQLAHRARVKEATVDQIDQTSESATRTDAIRQPPNTREGCFLCSSRRVSLPLTTPPIPSILYPWSHTRLRQSFQVLCLQARPSLSRGRRSCHRPSPRPYADAANTDGGPNDGGPTRSSESRRHAHARVGDPARRHNRRSGGWCWCWGRERCCSGVRRKHGTLGGGGAAVAHVCGVCSRCGCGGQ